MNFVAWERTRAEEHDATARLGFDPSGFDESSCACTLPLHEARELGLRHIHSLAPVLRDPIAEVRPGEPARDIPRKLVNDAGRSARWRPYPIPNREVESCDARFSDRRYLR